MNSWIDEELVDCKFEDNRLGHRFRTLLDQLTNGIGQSIPLACQDWASTKTAYRFLSNPRVDESMILAGHFQATRARFDASSGPVLVLQDTTEFSYHRERPDAIGKTYSVNSGRDKKGRLRKHTVCGVLMHSSLAVTTEGLPLGLAAIKLWTRKKFKGTNALKRKVNPTRVPIEKKESVRWLENLRQSTALFTTPDRCIHVGDRESDIYELFCLAEDLKTHFLVRTCVDRLAGDGNHTIADEMEQTPIKGRHRIQVRDRKGNVSIATLEIKCRRIQVLPPIGKQKKYPPLTLTVIHAQERGKPKDREPIDWKLITDLPVRSLRDVIEKLEWYAIRWQIETFHKILKSGCRAEDSKLRTADRLANLIAMFCILSWRVFWMTMINRSAEDLTPRVAFTRDEMKILDHVIQDRPISPEKKTLSTYVMKVARLGGYLARTNDPPPGNMVMWKGLSRLTDIELGFQLRGDSVGN